MLAAAAANKTPPRAVVEPLRTAQAQRAQHLLLAPPVNQATQRWGPDRASTQNLHQVDDEPARVRFLCSQVSVMIEPSLNQLEREVEASRTKLASDLSTLRSPATAAEFTETLKQEAFDA